MILFNEAIARAMRDDPYIPPAPVDDINKPLTFQSEQNGSTVALEKVGSAVGDFEISRNGGKWEDYSVGTPITLNRGHYVSFRAKTTISAPYGSYWHFVMCGKVNAYHNINSMASADFLNLSEIATRQFYSLFDGCTALYKAPLLPATTLSTSCYERLFRSTSLVQAPYLPATTLQITCYNSMFSSCEFLTQAPDLPATTLAVSCCLSMFSGCKSLTKAPELPATILQQGCYENIFKDCVALTEVRIKATTPAMIALEGWLYGVSASGTVYTDPALAGLPTNSPNGVPVGWVRANIADYPDD